MLSWLNKKFRASDTAPPAAAGPDAAQAQLSQGMALLQQGRHEDAQRHLRQALALDPEMAEAFYLLGAIAQQQGKLDAAAASYGKALSIKPGLAQAHSNLGIVLHMQGRPDAAIESYHAAIACKPDFAEAYSNMGLAFQAIGKLDDAVECYRRTIALKPDFAEAHGNLGAALQAQGKSGDAIASCRRALALKPGSAASHYNLGWALQSNGENEEAADHYRQAIALQHDHAEAHLNLGVTLQAAGSPQAAIEAYRRAAALKPDFAQAWYNLAHALEDRGDFPEAIAHYRQALTLRPDHAETHCNLGVTLRKNGLLDAAIESYRNALALKPDYAEALSNMGAALQAQGNPGLALECCRKALHIKPDLADAHWNEALLHLQLGDLAPGWEKFEWRWETDHFSKDKRNFTQTLWLGQQSLHGKTILLHAEQGLGDIIQFCRYARLVAAQGATVLLEVPLSLRKLLANLQGVDRMLIRGEALPPFDFHCPLLSLPLALGTRLHSIPSEPSYLASDPSLAAAWAGKFGPHTLPRIGLAWSGNALHRNDANRSVPLKEMLKLVSGNARFVSLQKEVRAADRAILDERRDILDAGAALHDFADTAGLIANLDLVISADTSVAHLAGAMGKPVWLLLPFNPDWRWLLERSDSPWYPSARLFRQSRIGDWSGVVAEAASELAATASSIERGKIS